jgi:sugar lactone lactonase YvrE
VLIADGKARPESLTVAPGGVVIVGSANGPFVYRIRAGAVTPEVFVDASAEGAGTSFLGMLADAAAGTLWSCQLTPVPNTTPPQRHSVVRGFDLATGAEKLRWKLPGDNSVCNDFTIGPDRTLYISDTANGRIFTLRTGAATADLFLEDRQTLNGIDGLTFLNGTLYVNNVRSNTLYRIPIDAAGKAGAPVALALSQPVKGPDGMRAAGGKIFVAENGNGRISAITVAGDQGTVMVVKEGLNAPTAVEPAGDTLWVAERGAGKAISIPMSK